MPKLGSLSQMETAKTRADTGAAFDCSFASKFAIFYIPCSFLPQSCIINLWFPGSMQASIFKDQVKLQFLALKPKKAFGS
jgi:hypothetical protein